MQEKIIDKHNLLKTMKEAIVLDHNENRDPNRKLSMTQQLSSK